MRLVMLQLPVMLLLLLMVIFWVTLNAKVWVCVHLHEAVCCWCLSMTAGWAKTEFILAGLLPGCVPVLLLKLSWLMVLRLWVKVHYHCASLRWQIADWTRWDMWLCALLPAVIWLLCMLSYHMITRGWVSVHY